MAKDEVIVSKLPPCDFCGEPAAYDGATRVGPWGFMCEADFKKYGYGLGVGTGQRLILRAKADEEEQMRTIRDVLEDQAGSPDE